MLCESCILVLVLRELGTSDVAGVIEYFLLSLRHLACQFSSLNTLQCSDQVPIELSVSLPELLAKHITPADQRP